MSDGQEEAATNKKPKWTLTRLPSTTTTKNQSAWNEHHNKPQDGVLYPDPSQMEDLMDKEKRNEARMYEIMHKLLGIKEDAKIDTQREPASGVEFRHPEERSYGVVTREQHLEFLFQDCELKSRRNIHIPQLFILADYNSEDNLKELFRQEIQKMAQDYILKGELAYFPRPPTFRPLPEIDLFLKITDPSKDQWIRLQDLCSYGWPSWPDYNISLGVEVCGPTLESFEQLYYFSPLLTQLKLAGCDNVPERIGDLTSLTELNLQNCDELKSLPKRFGELDLKKLDLHSCSALNMDAEINKIVEMKNLTELNIGRTNISVLSERFGECKSLTKLDLSWCPNLESLPDSIGDLTSLTELDLFDCNKLVSLPDSIGDLTSLTKLNLGSCRALKSLPTRIGECKSLTDLNLKYCESLVSLPDSIGDLKSLTKLDIHRCNFLVSLPERIGECKSLTDLNLNSCLRLVSLPERLGECKSLTFLNLLYSPAGRNMPGALKAQLKNQGCSGDGW